LKHQVKHLTRHALDVRKFGDSNSEQIRCVTRRSYRQRSSHHCNWIKRPLINPQRILDIVGDCRRKSMVPFHKQWGTYSSNPLVVEQSMSIGEAKRVDPCGKGGGLVDGALLREYPVGRNSPSRDAA
jgi:hypothetical protein